MLCCVLAPVTALASCVVSPNEARYELPKVELVTRGPVTVGSANAGLNIVLRYP